MQAERHALHAHALHDVEYQCGTGVTISSRSGHRIPALTPEKYRLPATAPTEKLFPLYLLQPQNIHDMLHACQTAKRCNVTRVMAEAVRWGERGARINSISPGIYFTQQSMVFESVFLYESDLYPVYHNDVEFSLCFFLYSEGDMFVLFMKALRKALIELNPERSAISLMLV